MRNLIVAFLVVLGLLAASCSSNARLVDTGLTDAEQTWCANPDDHASYDAIWESAEALDVNTVGHFMLRKAGITKDLDPNTLQASDLTDAEMEALVAVDDEFDSSDDIWLAYLATNDGTQACRDAYANVNG